MDFSIFNRKKQLNEFCEIIVVDFVNKKEVCRKTINNLQPINPEDEKQLNLAQKQVSEIRLAFIKNEEEKEAQKDQEKQGVGA